MSTPSGPGSPGPGPEDGAARAADAEGPPPAADAEGVTEAIGLASGAEPAPEPNAGRRYTAPGFDAGCTQVIDRVPDGDQDLMDAPTQVFASLPDARAAAPRAIAPGRRRRPRWLIPILVAAAVAVAAVLGVVGVKRSQAAKASTENAVRATIESFDTAIRGGDLATLRAITCGQTRQTYDGYDDAAWADTHARVSAAKQYPVVASVDDVVVDGERAEANVTTYMAFDPATRSVRSFDLQLLDGRWKICQ